MKNKRPYTREEAVKICADFQYIVGHNLIPTESRLKITYVAICPYSIDNYLSYADHHHYNEGLADYQYFSPNGEYDVIAISMSPIDGYNIYHRIERYCENFDVKYDFPQ